MKFVKIKSIRKVGVRHTYDLNTPKYENFFLDSGILSHNSGKTYAAIDFCLKVAEELGTPFTVENNISFEFTNLLRKMMLPVNSKPGTCFIMEEVGSVGSGAGSMTWNSKLNAFFSSFLQTSRHRRQIVIMTCPYFSMLMKAARQMVHVQMEMVSVNPANKISIAKAFVLQTNSKSGKIYFKHLRMLFNNRRIVCPRIKFRLPPSKILNSYEARKMEFTTALNNSILEESEFAAKLKKDKLQGKRKFGAKIDVPEHKIKELLEKKFTQKQMAAYFGVGHATITRRIKEMKDKAKAKVV